MLDESLSLEMAKFNGKKKIQDFSDTHSVKSVATSHFNFGGSIGKTTGGADRLDVTMANE